MESLSGSIKEKVTKVMNARKQLASMYGEKIKNLEYESGGGQSSGREKEQMYQCYIQDLNDQVDMLIALLAASEQKVCDLCSKNGGPSGQSQNSQNQQCCKPMCCMPCDGSQSQSSIGRNGRYSKDKSSQSLKGRTSSIGRNGRHSKVKIENEVEEDTPKIGIRIFADSGSQTALPEEAVKLNSKTNKKTEVASKRSSVGRSSIIYSHENDQEDEDEEEGEDEDEEDKDDDDDNDDDDDDDDDKESSNDDKSSDKSSDKSDDDDKESSNDDKSSDKSSDDDSDDDSDS